MLLPFGPVERGEKSSTGPPGFPFNRRHETLLTSLAIASWANFEIDAASSVREDQQTAAESSDQLLRVGFRTR